MTVLLKDATAPATSPALAAGRAIRTFQAVVVGTGTLAASVDIEVSNNNVDFLLLGTLSLSGTTRATDGFVSNAPWAFARAKLTAVTGTGAAVTVLTEA